jgi:hypothetical protein
MKVVLTENRMRKRQMSAARLLLAVLAAGATLQAGRAGAESTKLSLDCVGPFDPNLTRLQVLGKLREQLSYVPKRDLDILSRHESIAVIYNRKFLTIYWNNEQRSKSFSRIFATSSFLDQSIVDVPYGLRDGQPFDELASRYGRKFEVRSVPYESDLLWLAGFLPMSNGCVMRVWFPRPHSEPDAGAYRVLLKQAPVMSDDPRFTAMSLRVSDFDLLGPNFAP